MTHEHISPHLQKLPGLTPDKLLSAVVELDEIDRGSIFTAMLFFGDPQIECLKEKLATYNSKNDKKSRELTLMISGTIFLLELSQEKQREIIDVYKQTED